MKRERSLGDNRSNTRKLISRMRTPFWPTLISKLSTENCATVYTVYNVTESSIRIEHSLVVRL